MGYFIQSATASPAALPRPTPRPAPVDNFSETAKNEVPQFFTVESGYRFYSPELGRWLSRDPIGERGGLCLFAFAANDGISQIDMLGYYKFGIPPGYHIGMPDLQDTESEFPGTCGAADVTDALRAVLAKIENDFKKLNDTEKKCRCIALYHPKTRGEAWDIFSLYHVGFGEWPWPGIARGQGGRPEGGPGGNGRCVDTVVIGGACHKGGSVNYAMWGKINALCNEEMSSGKYELPGYIFSLPVAIAGVAYHKTIHWPGALLPSAALFTTMGYLDNDFKNAPCFYGECEVKDAIQVPLYPRTEPGVDNLPYRWESIGSAMP